MNSTISSTSLAARTAERRTRTGLLDEEMRQLIELSQVPLRRLTAASLLITGATGWIGTWLLDYFCAADDTLGLDLHITAVSREPAAFLRRFPAFLENSCLKWIKADVRQLRVESPEFSHIIHAATESSVAQSPLSPQQEFDTIVEGTRHTLACAGPECKSFLFLSSGAVYGPAISGVARFMDGQLGGPDASSMRSAYAEGKRAAEQLCAIAAGSGTPARIARCFAFMGPHMPFDRHFAAGNFIADAVAGRRIEIKSDGTPERSYMYMGDLMRALVLILTEGASGRTYNVGSDTIVTLRELAERIDSCVGGCGVLVAGRGPNAADRYVPDISRLAGELKFTPATSLESAIARTADWYRDVIGQPVRT